MKYKQQYDDDTLEFDPKGDIWKIACCDCGLVHEIALAVEDNGNIGVAIKSDKRATAQKRRHKKYRFLKRNI